MSRATKKPAPLSTGKTGLTLALASGTGGRVELVEVGVGEVVDVDDEVVEAGGLVVRTGANVVRTGVVVVVGWVVVVLDEVVVVDRWGEEVGVVRLVEGELVVVVEEGAEVVVVLTTAAGTGRAGPRPRAKASPAAAKTHAAARNGRICSV